MKKLIFMALGAVLLASCAATPKATKYHQQRTENDWTNVSSTTEVVDGKYLVYTLERAEYRGGAHGMETTTYFNYDIESGKRLTLDDIFTKEGKAALPSEIRAKIMTDSGVRSWAELMEKGCWLEESSVTATENFRMTDDGIRFWYNPYDIACFANGSTSVELKLAGLAGVKK